MSAQSAAGKARVLVAEDDAALRRLLELRLGMGPYDVRTVEDGADALALLDEWWPDVIVCDVMMPRISGLTVCRRVRTEGDRPDVPIILLTARVFDEDIESVVALGGISFMNKPFDFAELTAAIDACVAHDPVEGPVTGTDRLGWLDRRSVVKQPRRSSTP